jgi:hypothetical protein
MRATVAAGVALQLASEVHVRNEKDMGWWICEVRPVLEYELGRIHAEEMRDIWVTNNLLHECE